MSIRALSGNLSGNLADDGPQFYLDLDERGGTSPNGKPSYTISQAAAQIDRHGYSWNGSYVTGTPVTVSYAFRATAPGTMPNGTSGFSQFNAQQIAAAELALQAWADVANVTFVRVNPSGYSDSASILFGNYSSGAAGAAAFAYFPGSGVGGDVWVNNSLSYNVNPLLLDYGRLVLIHEIGHALGLEHPADYDASVGSPTYANAVYYEDTRQYTVMSYWSEYYTGGDFQGYYAAAPLLDDIAAIQRLYGANMTTRTGDTVYGFNSNTGRDFYSATSPYSEVIFAVWDAGGTDTLDFSGYADNQLIDLRQGYFSDVGGMIGNVAIAVGAVIENAFGGSGADTINGNSADNFLKGNGGADVMRAGVGNDTLDGGTGADVMYGGVGDDTYVVDDSGDQVIENEVLASDPIKPDPGIDTVQSSISFTLGPNVENLTLTGSAAINGTGNGLDNMITGNGGNNVLNGADGADLMYGGLGADTYIVDNVGDRAIDDGGDASIDLVQSSVSFALGDAIDNLELTGASAINGTGNSLANSLTGNSAANQLSGLAANDRLYGGAGNDILNGGRGNDLLDGGADSDTASYENAIAGVVVSLAVSGAQNTIGDGTDTLTSIENLTGSGFADTLIGDSVGNLLSGGGGNDVLDGGAGDDTLDGGFGADDLGGGAGNDTLSGGAGTGNDLLRGGSGDDSMAGGGGADTYYVDSLGDTVAENFNEGNDKVISTIGWTLGANVEQLALGGTANIDGTGNELVNLITGNSGDNHLYGLGGNDTLSGGVGNDVLDGGAANDQLNGGAGNDQLIGGEGNDLLTGGTGDDAMAGGLGNDSYSIDSLGDSISEALGEGTDTVSSSIAYTLGANLERLVLTGSADIKGIGNALDNVITGNSGANFLRGNGGNDLIDGGSGNDNIGGGAGRDQVTGGLGADQFVFNDGATAATLADCDVIRDFSAADGDMIDLMGMDANVGVDGDQAFSLIGTDTFHNVAGELRYEVIDGNTYVQGDTNGDGIADFMIRLNGAHALGTADFVF